MRFAKYSHSLIIVNADSPTEASAGRGHVEYASECSACVPIEADARLIAGVVLCPDGQNADEQRPMVCAIAVSNGGERKFAEFSVRPDERELCFCLVDGPLTPSAGTRGEQLSQ